MSALVSVVIPLYNKAAWIERCIQSVTSQTYGNLEILVIDDGSTDCSKEIVTGLSDKRIKLYEKPNGGPASARNLGIDSAEGDFIAFLDADDEWMVHHIEHLLRGFEYSKKVILVCDDRMEIIDGVKMPSNAEGIRFNNQIIADQPGYYLIENYLRTLADGQFLLSASSVLLRTDLVKENGIEFLQSAFPAEDENFWIRLKRFGSFVFCNYVGLYYHRVDPQSTMNRLTTVGKTAPPFFCQINTRNFSEDEIKSAKSILLNEYLKKAYQNRRLRLNFHEISTKFRGEIRISRFWIFVYFAIRYMPEWLLNLLKPLRTGISSSS